ncbi:MAG: OmpA family protein [Aquificaceae bacterium]|nr:OmpA family protein [Aquificaceae bacterium]
MRKVGLILITSVVLAQDLSTVRFIEGVNQLQNSMELAKRVEADVKNPYHFEKARASREVAYYLVSRMDDAGSRLFMIKAFNSISKSMADKRELDDIELLTTEGKKSELKTGYVLDIDSLNKSLKYLRENKALSCAPKELARGEVYYDAMVYELSKKKRDSASVFNFYERSKTELKKAEEKVKVAIDGNFECYTGKPFVPELAQAKLEDAQSQPKPAPPQTTESSQREASGEPPKESLREEPLMITARVHFDFNKDAIKKEYIPLLNEVVKVLKENPNVRLRVEGYTDDAGSKSYNQKLALRRAQAVKEYMIKAGIPAERIEILGFGKERFIAENQTPIGRFTNRRAEFIVLQVPGQ